MASGGRIRTKLKRSTSPAVSCLYMLIAVLRKHTTNLVGRRVASLVFFFFGIVIIIVIIILGPN